MNVVWAWNTCKPQREREFKHTLLEIDSKEFCKNGSVLWDQTKV